MLAMMIIAFLFSLFLAGTHSFEVPKPSRTISFLRAESPEDVAKKLREEAEKLRRDVEAFQQEKLDVMEAQKQELQQIVQEKEQLRNIFSAEVPILKGDGTEVVERIDFPQRFPPGTVSRVISCQAPLPLGIILGESEEITGLTVVDEVIEGGNGEAAGIRIGDIVRACTACQTMMKAPTWQIMAGGIGMPETRRFMYNIDGRPFEEVMEALGSNRMDPKERPVFLVLERKD